MQINTNNMISISEANQNFSKVARLVNEKGTAIILKNNVPRYVILDYSQFESIEDSGNEQIENVAKKIVANNLEAFKELDFNTVKPANGKAANH